MVLLWLLGRPLDAVAIGDESASGLGVAVQPTSLLLILFASLTTAAAVSASGIIGFVGLLAPHAARTLVGSAHRWLIPTSALVGAILLVLADDIARTCLEGGELPVGILTAMIGAPVFLLLLQRHFRHGTS